LKITNILGLPQPIVDAVQNDPYDSGDSDISVTRLIAPPRQVYLNGKHSGELTEDCSDRLFSLMGQAMHYILERGGDVEGKRIIERRLFTEVSGWRLSGQIDLWEDGVLSDYKFTSVWETMNGLKEEKVQQLNILAYLCRINDIPIEKVQIVAMYRDFSKSKSAFERDYPQHQIGILESPLWDDAKAKAFIEERIAIHKDAHISLPDCTPEEMWERPTKWAVMKEGVARAKRLLDSKEEAFVYAQKNDLVNQVNEMKAGFFIERRPGEKIRCENYCSAAAFCTQFNPPISV
jgi:hypothetical protein